MMYKRAKRPVSPLWRWGLVTGIILIIIAAAGYGIWGYKERHWNGKDRYTVIKTDGKITVESFDPQTQKGIRLELPSNLEIDGVGGRGKWMADVMPKLGNKYGWKWVGQSTADSLGIGYTVTDRDMGWWDKWEWWKNNSQVEWKNISLEGTNLTDERESADGVKILKLSGLWPDKARELFTSLGIADEGIQVEITNTTDVAGLGNHAARVIDTSGMQVVMVGNEQSSLDKCEITINENLKNSLSLQYLQREFGCRLLIKSDNNNNQINLKLGREYYRWWQGKDS